MSRSQRINTGNRLVTTLVATCLFAMTFAAQAQNLVINGDFENNSAITAGGANFNLSNSDFMNQMPNTIALGTPGELDIYELGAEDSDWGVALNTDYRDDPVIGDILAVELSGPLVIDNTYTVGLWLYHLNRKKTLMFVSGATELEGGLENVTAITSLGPPVESGTWECFSHTFTATAASTYLRLQLDVSPPAPSDLLSHQVVDQISLVAGETDPCPAPPLQLDNVVTGSSGGGLVFGGAMPEDGSTIGAAPSVIPNSGMLDTPYYYSRLQERHYAMTYNPPDNIIPLSFAMGVGTGSNFWHRNSSIVVSQIDNDRFPDSDDDPADLGALSGGATSTGFTVTRTSGDNNRGPGALQAVGEIVFEDGTVEVTHLYELEAGTNFIKVTSSARATSGTVGNVNMWVGTTDDWVGETDSPTSSLGLVQGEGASATFAPKCDGDTNAVLVQSGAEFLMLYSPDTQNAQAVLSSEINVYNSLINIPEEELDEWISNDEWIEGQPPFDANLSIIDQNPADSAYRIEENDGAHAMALSFGNVGTTPVSRTWYYQAGVLPDIPFDVCPNPQQQVYRSPDFNPNAPTLSVPTNSITGLLLLMMLMLGVAGVVTQSRLKL